MSGIIGSVGSKSGVIGTTEIEYEEGTVTVTFGATGGGSITLNSSANLVRYTRIGNMCHVSGRVSVSAVSGDQTGTVNVSLLPFVSYAGAEEDGYVYSAVMSNFNMSASNNAPMFAGYSGDNTVVRIYESEDNTTPDDINAADVAVLDFFNFNITYKIKTGQ
jgi:hypothetical protein